MLKSVRNFLSGKRVIVIAILLAIPFVFFGSTSFGTTFTSYGTVNGELVSQMDVNLATSQVSQRLKSLYGEDFIFEELDEEIALGLIKNEIINQKTLLSHARKLGLMVNEKTAKKEIINLEMFQGDDGFDQNLFESSIRANGWTPEEYIDLVIESISLEKLISAMGITAFPLDNDIRVLSSIFETSRDIDFIKVDKNLLINQQQASLEEGQEFYNDNPFLFLTKEQRNFSYFVLNYDNYKTQVQVPDNFIEEAYADYIKDIESTVQNRISHLMIDKSNYNDIYKAYEKIESIYQNLSTGKISFKDAVKRSSEDLASIDSGGDLGLSSGDAFPDEFEIAILSMDLNSISPVIELEDSFHILKLTEIIRPKIKSKSEKAKELKIELIDAEALAMMEDDFLKLESLVLEELNLNSIANSINASIQITGLQDIENIKLIGFDGVDASELFAQSFLPNKIEIYESDNSYAFVMMTQLQQPDVQPFTNVAEKAIEEVRIKKANKIIEDFEPLAIGAINGENMLPNLDAFSKDSYIGVKRFSSLLPTEIINSTFESPVGKLVSNEAFNGDRYWAKSSNELIPTNDEIGEFIEQYQGFYNENLGQQFSGFIDHSLKQGQRIRLENLNL